MRHDDSATRFELVPYFHGKILDMSEGRSKAFPHFVSSLDLRVDDATKLPTVAGQSYDGVFSSYLLHVMPLAECKEAISEWSRVIKPGGHIMLHLPLKHEDEKWPVSYDSVVALMESLKRGWDMVSSWRHPEEGSALFVFRLEQGGGHRISWAQPRPEKKCGVVRLGAFGDLIQTSSILPWLKEQGYHITMYVSDHGYPVIKHDPHVDRFIIQGRDEVPPEHLGRFWDYERKKYDKWINLSESVEGTLLPAPGSLRFDWPEAVKAKYLDVNYLEFTHELAGVPPPYRPQFYATPDERAWARKTKAAFGGRCILWSLSGSSVHKTWPWLDEIVASILVAYQDVHVVLVGDELSQLLEECWQRPEGAPKNSRVHCRSGVWTIRESMAFCEVADVVIGCETGVLNAAGSMETPKIVTLSHSSEKMLTKHWRNATALSQPRDVTIGCPKQPCRQLHHSFDHCHEYKTEKVRAALCQAAIDGGRMWEAVVSVLGAPKRDRKVA